MQKHVSPSSDGSKLLPFLRSVAAPLRRPGLQETSPFLAPSSPPVLMEARLAYPVLGPLREATGPARGRQQLSSLAALTHDARNALTSLALISGLLAEPGVLQAQDAHYAQDLQSVGDALTSLIAGIAASGSHPAAETPGVAGRPAEQLVQAKSASAAIDSCTRLLRTVAGSQVAVHVSSESGLPPLAISESALLRVLMNLVKNAGEAMPEGGTVRITARRALSRSEPAVLIHVCDDGPGIAPLALKQIFDVGFSTKQDAHRGGDARGLGLAIVRELVEGAGGRIEVASTRRRGTTFELRLPCIVAHPA